MRYLALNSEEFYDAWEDMEDGIREQLENEFQNEEAKFYEEAPWKIFLEYAKDGDSIPNIINRLYR